MATFSFVLHLFLLLVSSAASAKPSPPKTRGISASLIHRDSPSSPLYDPSSTPTQRAEQAALRSRRRSQRLASAFDNGKFASSVAHASDGEYLMKLSIGTPSRPYWFIMDTASDVTWVTCRPCETCFVHEDLLFEPQQSASYGSQICTNRNCAMAKGRCDDNQLCVFQIRYGDQSIIRGDIGSEIITFDDDDDEEMSFSGIIFGCVHGQSAADPLNLQQPGLVGLGQGAASLVSQISPTVGKKFAYCLPPTTSGNEGWIKFGDDADEYDGEHEIQEISMGQDGPEPTFYTILLEDISVDDDPVSIEWRRRGWWSNDADARLLVVDSGTEALYLAPYVYDQVKEAVDEAVDRESFIGDGRLCFHVDNEDPYEGLPELTLHFDDADWKLPPAHAFMIVPGAGVACLAMEANANAEVGILGSRFQQNMYIKLDFGDGLLSFAPMDCDDE